MLAYQYGDRHHQQFLARQFSGELSMCGVIGNLAEILLENLLWDSWYRLCSG